MPRRQRIVQDGGVYHVLNRRAGKLPLFETDADYLAFENVIDATHRFVPMRVLAYCLMPNHWHLMLWPVRGKDLSRFMQRLTVTHMRRWHVFHGTEGTGPVYQGRFKSFPIETDVHALTVARYVERNARRARLVRRAEQWRWCSLWRRSHEAPPWLVAECDWPVELPRDWVRFVNEAQTDREEAEIRRSIERGAPFGSAKWQHQAATAMKLQSSLRDPWRPRKDSSEKRGRST